MLSDRLSRALHAQARAAPAIPADSHSPCKCGQGARQARTANPWPTAFGFSGCVRHARRPWLAVVSFSERSSWKPFRFAAERQTAPYCCCARSPPIPLEGAWVRPSNITPDYAHMSLCVAAGRQASLPGSQQPARIIAAMLNGRAPSLGLKGLAFPTPGYLDCPPWRAAVARSRRAVGPWGCGAARGPKTGPCSFAAAPRPFYRRPRPPLCQVPVGSSQRKNRAVFRFRPAPATPRLRRRAGGKALPCMPSG